MTRPKSAFDALMAKKQKSPENIAGKKRGRPTKNSPRFIKKSNKNLVKSSTPLPKRSLNFHEENSNQSENLENEMEKLKVEEPPIEICLNGKSELSDIRKLFREWIYQGNRELGTFFIWPERQGCFQNTMALQ